MKKHLLFGVLAISLCGVTGLTGVGLNSINSLSETVAVDEYGDWYFAGNIASDDTIGFDDSTRMYCNDGNLGYKLNITFAKNDRFLLKKKDTWDGKKTFSDLGGGNASGFFVDNGSGDIKYNGSSALTVDVYLNSAGKIYITLSDTGLTSYSYLMVKPVDDAFYTNAYLYNSGSDKLTEWGDSPALDRLGIEAVYDSWWDADPWYKLYRVDDRILDIYSHLILKKGSSQAATFAPAKDGAVWIFGDETIDEADSDTSAAAALVADIATARGAYTYDGFGYGFSICAVGEKASGLVSRYDVMSSTAKTKVANWGIKTYNVEGEHSEGNKANTNYGAVVESLRALVAKQSSASSIASFSFDNGNDIAVIAGAIGIGALLSVGGLFLLRKRKAE